MADEQQTEDETPKKKSKLPLLIGLVLALAGGGGGFFAVQSGLLFASPAPAASESHAPKEATADPAAPEVAFIPVDKLVISLGNGGRNSHLLFKSQLEVGKGDVEEVTALLPRVVDVLNSYLRAVNMKDLEDPTALVRLRAQMLRRIQTVVGKGRVHDLLIMEFVLN